MKRIASILLAGVVSFPVVVQAEDTDPWESMNRNIFVFNEWLDEYIAKPVAEGYREVMPSFADKGVTNFFSNLGELENTVNNVLQLKVEGAGVSVSRFAINSTLGWFGLVDIATHAGLSERDEDFGQTLGYWGAPSGPYVVLPLLGPSTVRDTVGKVGDSFTDPMGYEPMNEVLHSDQRLALTGLKAVDKRADLLGAEKVIFGEDKYAFMRDAYLQTREYKVQDGEVEDPFADSIEEFDDLPE